MTLTAPAVRAAPKPAMSTNRMNAPRRLRGRGKGIRSRIRRRRLERRRGASCGVAALGGSWSVINVPWSAVSLVGSLAVLRAELVEGGLHGCRVEAADLYLAQHAACVDEEVRRDAQDPVLRGQRLVRVGHGQVSDADAVGVLLDRGRVLVHVDLDDDYRAGVGGVGGHDVGVLSPAGLAPAGTERQPDRLFAH